MSLESAIWFAVQVVAAVLALMAGRRLRRAPAQVWKSAAVAATACMLVWPLMRFHPAAVLSLLGTRLTVFLEVTGIIVPAVLLFSIAAQHAPKASERRALHLMVAICGLYLVQYGKWMVREPVPDLAPMQLAGEVCLQTTDYTCVAASLVTLLKAHGVATSETEMAWLSHTEPGNGTTDSRAIYGLEQKLADRGYEIHFEVMDYDRLRQVEKPCVVPIDWGYFVSHMVPVLSADECSVRVGDPLTGPRLYGVEEFLSVWKGRGIYLTADERLATGPAGSLSAQHAVSE